MRTTQAVELNWAPISRWSGFWTAFYNLRAIALT